MEKSISYLKTKVWYRLVKVVYITLFIFIMLGFNGVWVSEEIRNINDIGTLLVIDIVITFIFFLIRGAFYYIAIGSFNPKK